MARLELKIEHFRFLQFPRESFHRIDEANKQKIKGKEKKKAKRRKIQARKSKRRKDASRRLSKGNPD